MMNIRHVNGREELAWVDRRGPNLTLIIGLRSYPLKDSPRNRMAPTWRHVIEQEPNCCGPFSQCELTYPNE